MFDNLTLESASMIFLFACAVFVVAGIVMGSVAHYLSDGFRRLALKRETDAELPQIEGHSREGPDWYPIVSLRGQHYVLRPNGAIEQTAQRLKVMKDTVDELICQRDNWKAIAELRSESLHKAIGDGTGLDHREELR